MITIKENGDKIISNGDMKYILHPLPQEIKEKAVNTLKKELNEIVLQDIRDLYGEHGDDWAMVAGIHMFFGMQVRNILRKTIKDDELPKNTWNGHEGCQNWDDYFRTTMGCRY